MKFIRVHGKVIPITDHRGMGAGTPAKLKGTSQGGMSASNIEALKGAGLAAAGAAIAIGGAHIYKKTLFRATSSAMNAFNKSNVVNILTKTTPLDIAKFSRHAETLDSIAKALRVAAPIAGGALLFYGGTKIIDSQSKNKLSPTTKAAIVGIGGIGGATLGVGLTQGKKLFEFGLNNPQTQFAFAKTGAMDFIKSYGSKILKNIK
jgi:hypothetical protein